MAKHRSFKPSDFSLRDLPGFLAIYIVAALLSVGFGLFVQNIPEFWSGLFSGVGFGFLGALALLYPVKKVAVEALPKPSATVRAICEDPDSTLVEAVKAYREETGLGLNESTEVVKDYIARSNSNT